jgi:hypothetical protein
MITRLAIAELRHRPGRALFLLGGYSLGVAVMVVLLAVGEAMLEQARNQALVGGGDMIVVPAGISTEMLRSGGTESLFLGLDQARFLQREVLEGERGREQFGIRSASPVLDGKRVEIRAGEQRFAAIATGEVPSRARAAGALPELLAGRWDDSDADRRWVSPTAQELYREIDRFHRPAGATAEDSTWAEWHYFNVVLDQGRWLYLTFLVGGRMADPDGWGGRILLTLREPSRRPAASAAAAEGTHRSLTRDFTAGQVRFDTASPNLQFGVGSFVRLENGEYRVVAEVDGASVDLQIAPAPGRYFPPADLGGTSLVSGYTVPALYAEAVGSVCLPRCERVAGAQAYHDHNWGVWRGISWEWGAASNERLSLLYGVVRGDSTAEQGVFAYLVDERGPVGIYRPREIRVTESQSISVGGRRVLVPRQLIFGDERRGLEVTIDVEAVHVTDLEREAARYFVQMRGVARVVVEGGRTEELPGFFETYVDASPPEGVR